MEHFTGLSLGTSLNSPFSLAQGTISAARHCSCRHLLFPYIQRHFAQALSTLSSDWNIHGHLKDDSVQNVITSQMKALAYQDFLDSCPSDDRARITAVGLQTIPTRCSTSQICPVRVPGSDHLDQCPMSLFSLMCPFELSNQAFVTSMSICLGVPVPHARFLTFTEQYADIDVWADFLLTDAAHASRRVLGLGRIHMTAWLIAFPTWQLGLDYLLQPSRPLSQ